MKAYPKRRGRAMIWATAVFSLFAIPLLMSLLASSREREHLVAVQTEAVLDELAERLEADGRAKQAVINSLKADAPEVGNYQDYSVFTARSQAALNALKGVQAINWVKPSGRIAAVVPSQGNESALGKSLLDHPQARPAFELARATGLPAMTTPLELFQGGRGVAIFFPVDGGTRGYFDLVIRLDELAGELVSPAIARLFDVELLDAGLLLVPGGPRSVESAPFERSKLVPVLGRSWTLTVAPSQRLLLQARGTWVGLVFWGGMLLNLVSAISLYSFLVSRWRRMQRARRVASINQLLMRLTRLAREPGSKDEFFRAATKLGGTALGVNYTTIWSCSPDTSTLFVDPLMYNTQKEHHRRPAVTIDAADYPQWKQAIERDSQIIANNASEDPRTSQVYFERLSQLGPLAVMDVLVRARGKWLGLVTFLAVRPERAWTEEDEFVARQIAELAALRFEEEARTIAEQSLSKQAVRLKATNSMLQSAGRLLEGLEADEKRSARELTQLCGTTLEVSRAALWRCIPGSTSVRIVAMCDVGSGEFSDSLVLDSKDYSEYWAALKAEGRIITEKAQSDPRTRKLCGTLMPIYSQVAMLDVAIVVKEEIVGLLSCHLLERERAWTAEDEILVASLADLLALHFERTERRRIEAARERSGIALGRHVEALARIAEIVASGPALEEAARRLAKLSAWALDVTSASIWLGTTPGSAEIQLKARYYPASDAFESGETRSGTISEEYRDRVIRDRTVAVSNGTTDPCYAEIHTALFPQYREMAVLAAGVRSRGVPVGMISFIIGNASRQWSLEEELFAGAVADAYSLVLEANARIRFESELIARNEELEKATAALARLATSEAVKEGNIHAAFRELTALCANTLGLDRVSCWHVSSDSSALKLEDEYYRTGGHCGSEEVLLLANVPEYWEHVRTGENLQLPVALGSLPFRQWAAERSASKPGCSVLHVPISAATSPLGVLCFEQLNAERSWSREDILFANACADLASLTWERAARNRAQQAEDDSRRRLRLLIDGTPFAVIEWDPEGQIVGWNPAAHRIFGYSQAEMLGEKGLQLFFENQQDTLTEILRPRFSDQPVFSERFSNLRKNQSEILCDWRNTVLRAGDSKVLGVASLVEDVTTRVAIEREIRELNSGLEVRVEARTQELEKANAQLRELDRLKTEFLATMSHELRTPLNSIIGFSGLLEAGMAGEINAEQATQLGMVSFSAKHLLSLITDLLDLSRIEAGRMRFERTRFSPQAVVHEVHQTLMPLAQQKGLEFTVSADLPSCQWWSDRGRVFQIFLNLANNAVKFTASGSVCLSLFQENENFVLQVEDTGIGIPDDKLSWLFEAFRQMDGSAQRQHEGTGLGLFFSKKLAGLLGGDIRVKSKEGVGSVFALVFHNNAIELQAEAAVADSVS